MQRIRKSIYSIILMGVLITSLASVAAAESVVNADTVKIDINRATAAELQQLKGVGEVIAGRIVAYREEFGAFKTVDEIKNVKGIGEKVYEKLKDFIQVGEAQASVVKH